MPYVCFLRVPTVGPLTRCYGLGREAAGKECYHTDGRDTVRMPTGQEHSRTAEPLPDGPPDWPGPTHS